MFKWLADMIIKTPVQGTCSCCEGKKEQLRKMQKAILENNESENESLFEHDSCSCGGKCHCSNHSEENTENSCHCHKEKEGECCCAQTFSSASYTASYSFDKDANHYQKTVTYHAKDTCCCQNNHFEPTQKHNHDD